MFQSLEYQGQNVFQRAEREISFLSKHRHHYHLAYLKGSLISVCPHMNVEGGIVRKLLVANLTAETRSVFGLVERALEMGQHMLLQGSVGGKSAAARPHWAFERGLARVG